MGQNPVPPPPGLPRRGEGDPDTPEPRGRQGGPTSEELFWRTTDQVVDHLNRQTRSDPPIKRDLDEMEREIAEMGQEGGVVHTFAKEWWNNEDHQRLLRRERDIMFQIRVMDWMIGFCVTALVVVLCVGAWAIWQMLTIGWRG